MSDCLQSEAIVRKRLLRSDPMLGGTQARLLPVSLQEFGASVKRVGGVAVYLYEHGRHFSSSLH